MTSITRRHDGSKVKRTIFTVSLACYIITFAHTPSWSQTPVGMILAWHKHLPGVPPLGDAWVECNGQTVADPESPLNGKQVPNLNAKYRSYHSKGLFLRGGNASGVIEDDAFQGHWHDAQISGLRVISGTVRYTSGSTLRGSTSAGVAVREPISDSQNGTPRTSMETRPVNMSVVWIMKIKN